MIFSNNLDFINWTGNSDPHSNKLRLRLYKLQRTSQTLIIYSIEFIGVKIQALEEILQELSYEVIGHYLKVFCCLTVDLVIKLKPLTTVMFIIPGINADYGGRTDLQLRVQHLRFSCCDKLDYCFNESHRSAFRVKKENSF